MGQLTATFQELSQRVIEAEAALNAAEQGDLAALLRTVQVRVPGSWLMPQHAGAGWLGGWGRLAAWLGGWVAGG